MHTVGMHRFDVPEALIALLLAASLVWAVYNWLHPGTRSRKAK